MKPTIYLAYGSNLNLAQMFRRCPTAEILGTTKVQGYDLKFRGDDGNAVATIEPTDGRRPGESTVPALLWTVQPRDERALDIYEGWPRLYRKELLEVELDGKPLSAMVYIMNDGYELGNPSDPYYDIIAEGYASAGFDLAVLQDAISRSQPEVWQAPEMGW